MNISNLVLTIINNCFLKYRVNKCKSLKKLGTSYGGWIVPTNLLNKKSVCYCVGAGEDISFDCKLAEQFGCQVHIFDPTPQAKSHFDRLVRELKAGRKMNINNNKGLYKITKKHLKLLHFFPYGIWNKDGRQKFYVPADPSHVSHSLVNLQKTVIFFEAECKKIGSIMAQLGHNNIDLLKLDIEGAEYMVVDSLIRSRIYPKIFCLEFDETNSPLDLLYFLRVRKAVRNILVAGYTLVARAGYSEFTFVHWQ